MIPNALKVGRKRGKFGEVMKNANLALRVAHKIKQFSKCYIVNDSV